MRRWYMLLVVTAAFAGCSKGKTTEELIREDVRARGLDKPPASAAPAPAAADFKPYSSPDGSFRINLPGDPRVVDHGPSEPDHRTGMQSYVVERQPRQYSVLCTHFDEAPEPAKEIQRLTDLAVSRSLGGKLVSSTDVTVENRPGKDIVVADEETARRARLLIDGKDVYQISVDLPKDEADGEAAKNFLASFELIKN